MADRIIHQPATLYANIPGASKVNITILNPLDQHIVDTQDATWRGDSLFSHRLTSVGMSGIWQAVWQWGDNDVYIQNFTVAEYNYSSVTKFDARTAVARRVDQAHIGRVAEAYGETFVDDTVLGGKDSYRGWWITVRESGLSIPRRVTSFTGSGFTVSPAFVNVIQPGTTYLLSESAPDEIDMYMNITMTEVSEVARIETHIPNVPFTEDGSLFVPRGINSIHDVYIDGKELTNADWDVRPGRKVVFSEAQEGSFADVVGTRAATSPVWDDSYLEFDAGTVIAGTAAQMHATRARGQGADMDEHLRRHLAALDEYEGKKSLSVGRPFPGARRVID